MFTGVAVTLDVSVLAGLMVCAGGAGAVALHGVHSVRRRISNARNKQQVQSSLANVLSSEEFNREINDVSERQDRRQDLGGTDTLVHAKLDRMREVQQIWGQETRQNALEQVAAIMKRSVRKADAEKGTPGDLVNDVEGDGFTILVRGAEERDASLIAKRLRSELARTPIKGLSDNIRLTASFGVASRRMGESLAAWRARAEDAVNAASAQGEDQIVEASIVEEMTLLPPPSPKANPKVA
ncbi:MAG: GGDEF domain-containing protein [Pseudomonadota bacterium]